MTGSDMEQTSKPKALILVSGHCPHCYALEKLLQDRMARAMLEELEVINIEQSPEIAQQYGIRSVPWLRLGGFAFDEALMPAELDKWIELATHDNGLSRYIVHLLEHGKLAKAIEWIEKNSVSLKAVVSILIDPDTKINVRVGIGAILEHFENTDTIREILPDLVSLLQESSATVRTDVCHYLSLTHDRKAIEPLKGMLEDQDLQVRQVAKESIEVLME